MAEYQYDELSRRILLTYGNDANIVYQYDIGNRLTRITNNMNASSIDIQYSEYDNVGNRENMIVDNNEYLYSYDKLYQLIFVDYPSGLGTDANYYYDCLGSRTKVETTTVTDYSSNNLNQYTAVGTTLPEYDTRGNLTQYGAGAWRYLYDCENRLTDVNLITIKRMHCEYDYLGRRVSKAVYPFIAATNYKYVYDGDNLIAEYNGNNVLLRKYIYGDNIDEPICIIEVSQNNSMYYYHYDGLGSVVALSDSNGIKVRQYRYDTFGTPTVTNFAGQTIGNRFMFTGREYDNEYNIGLYYYRARFYKPSIGRFMQTDPIGYYDSMNLYQYCLNNPVNFMDPLGLRVGDRYRSQRDAASAALNQFNPRSQRRNREYGGWIIRNKDGTFSYTHPRVGGNDSVKLGRKPNNATAYYHTHGAYDPQYGSGNENFSPADRHVAQGNNSDAYVGTPNNNFKEYDPRNPQSEKGSKINTTDPAPSEKGFDPIGGMLNLIDSIFTGLGL